MFAKIIIALFVFQLVSETISAGTEKPTHQEHNKGSIDDKGTNTKSPHYHPGPHHNGAHHGGSARHTTIGQNM